MFWRLVEQIRANAPIGEPTGGEVAVRFEADRSVLDAVDPDGPPPEEKIGAVVPPSLGPRPELAIDAQAKWLALRQGLAAGLRCGVPVTVDGIGCFVLQRQPARLGRDPTTGQRVEIPAKLTIKLEMARDWKREMLDRLSIDR